jgi:hypothetical protein
MKTQASTYDAAIAAAICELEARIEEQQDALIALKRLQHTFSAAPKVPSVPMGVDPVVQSHQPLREPTVALNATGGIVEIAPDAFAGMMIADAAERYLGMVMQPKTLDEIAVALERGGLEHASIDFLTVLRTTLAKHERFTRINNVWALTAWHPDIAGKETKKLTLEQKIVKAMGSEPGSVWLPRRMALAIHANLNSVQSVMSEMAQNGRLHKEPRGYSLPKPKPVAVHKTADVA